MAKNRIYTGTNETMPALPWVGPQANTSQLPKSGDPCVYGKIPGFAANDADSDGNTVAYVSGTFTTPVKAEGGALAAGALVYFDAADATTPINDDSAGVKFGYVLDAIGSGATNATARVRLFAGS